MIKPKRLSKGDKVAIVSLSRGMLGEDKFIHKYSPFLYEASIHTQANNTIYHF